MSEVKRYGIDVSEWQGNICWPKVRESGVAFAMIRATHGLKRDAYFEKNMEAALEAGISIGVYCCSYATTVAGILEEAAYFLETIRPWREEIAFPAAIDAEQESQFRLGRAVVTELLLTFCEAVVSAGYLPMVYSNCNWLNCVIDETELSENGIDVWVAWPHKVASFAEIPVDGVTKHDHTMWQFSNVGKIDGISGPVDLNISYADYAEEAPVLPDRRYVSWEEAAVMLAELGCEGILL